MKTMSGRNFMIVLLFAFLGCEATFTNNEKITGYNFTAPDVSFVMPDTLREVSGLTAIDSTSFACVQDENGVLFIYDAIHNRIKKQYSFNFDGDYEGIARVDKNIYILRSDGNLFEISDFESKDFHLSSYTTGIPANNNEGLCYDHLNNRLLIACKGKIEKGPKNKDKRVIYGFDLKTKMLSSEPVFEFDLQAVKAFAREHNIPLPTRQKKRNRTEPIIKFMTSAIGIHPLTGKLYLLSAADHLLFILNTDGSMYYMEYLHPVMFNKAEGITFFENGDMLITNEAQNHKPTLLRFNYRKN